MSVARTSFLSNASSPNIPIPEKFVAFIMVIASLPMSIYLIYMGLLYNYGQFQVGELIGHLICTLLNSIGGSFEFHRRVVSIFFNICLVENNHISPCYDCLPVFLVHHPATEHHSCTFLNCITFGGNESYGEIEFGEKDHSRNCRSGK